jgi:tetratricopeptide (TPR) repeat protein
MKLLTIAVTSALIVLPLRAEDAASGAKPEWKPLALHAQALLRQNKLAEAAEYGQQALSLARQFGPTDARLASTYHMLGLIYRDWGHCAESRANYAHAIAIWHRQAQPNPRYITNSVMNYLSNLCECGDFAAAQKAFHRYEAELTRYSSDPVDEARMFSLRGVLARGRKNYPQAEAYFRQAIEVMEGVVLDKEGHYAEALAESEKVIAVLGEAAPHHPSLIAAYNNAACALADLGRGDESERMFQEALQAARELYGEENHVTAQIMLSYAGVLRQDKQAPAAEVMKKKGTEAFRRALLRDAGTVDVEELQPGIR